MSNDIRFITDTSKELLNVYYNAYLENLREFASQYKCLFVSPKDIKMDIEEIDWCACRDPYLTTTNDDRLALGRDIKDNGTFWHIATVFEDGEYKLRDGVHRIWSIQQLDKIGEWPKDKKLLITTATPLRDKLEWREMNIPTKVDFSYQVFYSHIYQILYQNKVEYDDDKPLVKIKMPHRSLYLCCVMYAALLRDAIFATSAVKPSIILNSEEEWKKWIQ